MQKATELEIFGLRLIETCESHGFIYENTFKGIYEDIIRLGGSRDIICGSVQRLIEKMEKAWEGWKDKEETKQLAKHAEVLTLFLNAILGSYVKKDILNAMQNAILKSDEEEDEPTYEDNPKYEEVYQRFLQDIFEKDTRVLFDLCEPGVIPRDVFIEIYEDIIRLSSRKDIIQQYVQCLKKKIENAIAGLKVRNELSTNKHAEVLTLFLDAVLKSYEKKDKPEYEDVDQLFRDAYNKYAIEYEEDIRHFCDMGDSDEIAAVKPVFATLDSDKVTREADPISSNVSSMFDQHGANPVPLRFWISSFH